MLVFLIVLSTMEKRSTDSSMDQLVSTKTLSERLDISVNTIRWWVATGKVPYVKLGKLVRFDVVKIQRFIDANTVVQSSL